MKVKLEDISPELLIELERKAEEVQLRNITGESLRKISELRTQLLAELQEVTFECKVRAIRAHSLGFTKKELSEIFNVTTREINKWLGE